jgi:hypothetical protein
VGKVEEGQRDVEVEDGRKRRRRRGGCPDD